MASLHHAHLAMVCADRFVALRAGRVVGDAPAASFGERGLEEIYQRVGLGLEDTAGG